MVQAGWQDCPHLDPETVADMMAALPPHQRDARSKGVPALGSGAIYPIAESEFVVTPFDLPPSWRRCFGMDVGWNRTAVVWGAIDDQSDTVYIYSEYYRGQAEPSVHVDAIKTRGEMYGVIDPASRGRSQKDGDQLFEIYKGMGLKIAPAKNGVEAGIFEVYQRLSTGRLKIFSSCQNLISEYRLYRRDDKGRVVKDNDHALDALRYLIMSGIDLASLPTAFKESLTGKNQHEYSYNPLSKQHVALDNGSGMSQHKINYTFNRN